MRKGMTDFSKPTFHDRRNDGGNDKSGGGGEIDNEKLIDLAYSMAIEPQRFDALYQMLDEHLQNFQNTTEPEDNEGQDQSEYDINAISNHFERAFGLLNQQGRRTQYATGSTRYVDSDTRPSALIRKNGSLFHANQPMQDLFGFSIDKTPDASRFDHGEYDRLLRDVKTLKTHQTDKMISVYKLLSLENDMPFKMALSHAVGYDGKPIGRLSTFHIKWLPEMGQQFKESFDLTDVDLAITKAIVSGLSLRDLASERGRSINTVRTQTKALLTKLGLHSQIELACYYSGFSQFNLKDPTKNLPTQQKKDPWRTNRHLSLPDNRIMDYVIAGPDHGRPVLFFHALSGGQFLSQSVREQLTARNIRLILVWRPFYANTSPDGAHRDAPERFAGDVCRLLDFLKISQCQILGINVGAVYAYACAQFLKTRISGLVNCATSAPMTHEQLKHMALSSRAVGIFMARYTPKLLPMLSRAMLSSIDAGYDLEFMQAHFANTPDDQKLFNNPETLALFRDSYSAGARQGHMFLVRDGNVQAGNWGHLAQALDCPVTLIHGENDTAYPLELIRKFVDGKSNFTLLPIPKAGHLVYFQQPGLAFSALDAQIAKE
jgi:pimeloyl-ACP methyl ester carboxylesterase/DNA-binding CsgD family transcriptional regulator